MYTGENVQERAIGIGSLVQPLGGQMTPNKILSADEGQTEDQRDGEPYGRSSGFAQGATRHFHGETAQKQRCSIGVEQGRDDDVRPFAGALADQKGTG